MVGEQRPSSEPIPNPSNSPSVSNDSSTPLQINLPAGVFAGQPIVFGLPAGIQFSGARPTTIMQSWQGPYPPPDAIEKYEKSLPGAFNRILSMAERMEAAQIEQSAQAMRNQANDVRRAHYFGAGLGALAIGGAIIMGFAGQPWLATAFLAVPVMGLARAFVDGWRGQDQKTEIGAVEAGASHARKPVSK